MAGHTTFRVGGPADLYAIPDSIDDLVTILNTVQAESVPCFILGGGANIVVADAGIRGIVVDMSRFSSMEMAGDTLVVGAGAAISDAAAFAADGGRSGLGFIYAMPGSVGGAVWMNARCYGGEISDILDAVDVVTAEGDQRRYLPQAGDFGYKRSPFQTRNDVMVSVSFRLNEGTPADTWKVMRECEADRRAKGHFDAPCAGSVFKNNRAFGKPSGQIIDEVGLRGTRVGGAQVSDRHANIIVNNGSATAAEIRQLVDQVRSEVLARTGYELESEIMFVGDWGET